MEIAALQEGDLAELAQLYQQLLPNDISIARMRVAFERNRNNENHLILAAKLDYKLVGTLLAVVCEMLFGQCKSFMVIEDVIVDEGQRRKGIGKALMRYAEKYARSRNCTYIMLITDADRLGSQEFYRSLGYATEEYKAFKKSL